MGQFGANYGANYDISGVATGIQISGNHAQELIGNPAPFVDLRGRFDPKIKPKKKTHTFSAQAKVTRLRNLSATARIENVMHLSAVSKINRVLESKAVSKITRIRSLKTEASIFTRNEPLSKRYQNPHNIEEAIREDKKRKIRKLFDQFKDDI